MVGLSGKHVKRLDAASRFVTSSVSTKTNMDNKMQRELERFSSNGH
jgi:hypothetical protein